MSVLNATVSVLDAIIYALAGIVYYWMGVIVGRSTARKPSRGEAQRA